MSPKLTRTATRRSGDDYQDLVAAKAILVFLKHPFLHRWIKLEAREAGTLDDVLVLRADHTVEATQVKFSTDVERRGDPWTWGNLLRRRNQGKGYSLIQQWWQSVAPLDQRYGKTKPKLFSNRKVGDDLFLTATGRIDVGKTSPDVLEQIKSQLGEDADDFIERFHFEVNERGIDDLTEHLQREFQSLGLPDENWLGFMNTIRSWIRCENLPPNGELQISDLRRACGWTQLSQLNQDLEIPDDFVIADDDFHGDLLRQVLEGNEPVTVVTAGPGIGKSTYLSYLVEVLQESGCPVVRHHYSLGPGRDGLERVDAYRIAESLMADIQADLRSHLAGINTQNPNAARDLRRWLEAVGKNLSEQTKRLVVVIDGLDHVWRAKDSREELNKLFDQLLPTPAGIALIVGTQPVEDQQLPASLLTCAPKHRWSELPALDLPAVRQWLSYHQNLMPQGWFEGNQDWQLERLANSLHGRTGGHPLLIRYIVERITATGASLTWSEVENIPETPVGSVEEYYQRIWVNLPQHARDVMCLFAAARFRWPLNGLYETLRTAGYDQANAADGVEAVKHLLRDDRIGWRPFHNSALLFALEQPEFQWRKDELRQAAIAWLEEKAPSHLRRLQLWLLQHEAGDSAPLMTSTDRQWVVEAIAAGDPLTEVANILEAAAREAIKREDFPKYVDRGILADTVENAASIHYDALQWILETRLSMEGGEELAAREMTRLSELHDACITSLGLHSFRTGNSIDAKKCFDQINRRLNGETSDFQILEEERDRPGLLSELAGLIGYEAKRFVQFVNQISSETAQASLADRWIAGLRQSSNRGLALEALKELTGSAPKRCLSRYLAVDNVAEGIKLSDEEAESLASPYHSVYQMLRDPNATTSLPPYPTPPTDAHRLEFDEYEQDMAYYLHDLFFCWLVHELQSPGHTRNWAAPADVQPWLKSALTALAQGVEEIATQWQQTGAVAVTAGYVATSALDYPPLRVPLADRQCADGLKKALRTITEDLLVCRSANGGSPTLSWDEVKTLTSHRFAGSRSMVNWVADGTFSIRDEVADSLCNLVVAELSSTVEPFGDRATILAMMSAIRARQGTTTEAENYLNQACENLIGYGYHKDPLLGTALDTLDIVAQHLRSWHEIWDRLAPAIGAIYDFTDGDETRYLPSKLGTLMMSVDPDHAISYLTVLMDDEQYWDVQRVLDELVATGDLTNSDVRALVSTCIHPDAIEILEERTAQHDEPGAGCLALVPRYSSNLSRRNIERLTSSSADEYARGMALADGVSPEHCRKYPPENLDQFIQHEGNDSSYRLGEKLCTWLCYWVETGRAKDALEAAEPYLLDDDQIRLNNEAARAARKIVGKTKSYRWLVKAHRSNHGWFEYWTATEDARERWRWLKDDFPDRRHEFLMATIEPTTGFSWHSGITIARLAEYLGYFDEWEAACAIARQTVETIAGLVSGQQLPPPPWIVPDSEEQ